MAKSVLLGRGPKVLSFCSSWVVSLIYEGREKVVGFRKWSTNSDIFSVGEPFAEMIGLDGMLPGLKLGLCIFGNR